MFNKGKMEQGANVIGAGTEIVGKIKVNGPIDIYGSIIGENGDALYSKDVISVLKGATVEGDITCIELYLQGTVKGDIKAEHKVQLLEGCSLEGNVYTKALNIEGGAKFNGRVMVSSEDNFIEEAAVTSEE